MTTTTNMINMTTLDCPYGCGEKLVVNEDGEANCPTNSGPLGWADECEGCTAYFPHADAVVDAAWNVVKAEKQQLRRWKNEVATYTELLRQTEETVARAAKLADRISEQHG